MRFEVLKRSNLKRNIVIGLLVVGIISAIILNFTKAKYKNTESIPLVNGTINYSLADLNIVAITIDGKEVDTIPDGNYELTSESYCTVNGEKDNNVKLSYDSATKGLSVTPMTSKGTKCYLDFNKKSTLKDIILANNSVNSGTPNFANTATTDEGVYKTQDDWGDSYYFRGSVNNNWVKFANFYWRIIRINGDGSIRVIYNGTSTIATGIDTIVKNSQKFNSSYNRSEYVGYMYTDGEQHGNTTNSSIKEVIDSWYNSNLASYADKISTEAGFCSDRNLKSGSWSSTREPLYYAAYGRLIDNKKPTLKCGNSNDLYTTLSSSKGNKKLSNPIGLITADEVIMAGGSWNSENSSYYLYNDVEYWTMSPYIFYVGSRSGSARMFGVDSSGNLVWYNVDDAIYIRPVINLSANITIKSGNGTSSTPYEI
ncbi:unknown [Mycoplasma sp. CAG:776]|nr:unknown [Mycoplasma sp. CAG:776]